MDNNISSQLIGINFGENILSVGDYSFHDCSILTAVTGGKHLNFIGTDGFRNCTNLSKFDRFTDRDSSHTFNIVGNYAFANTKLSKLYLSLRSSSIDTFWGDYCFAYNNSLTEVHFLSSSYMSNNMFCDCHNLKYVSYENNYTSYVYPYVFNNCSSLTSITLPNKIWMISEHMFHGCSNLRSVGFSDYGDGSLLRIVQRGAFYGCSQLTSIELPSSISSLERLQDGCFLNIPKLRRIKFNGMSNSQLANTEESVVEANFNLGEIYENPDNVDVLIREATSLNIPIVWFHSGGSYRNGGTCKWCRKFNQNIDKDETKQQVAEIKVLFIYDTVQEKTVKNMMKRCASATKKANGNYVNWGIEWTKSDGTVNRYHKQSGTSKDYDLQGYLGTFPGDRIKEILTEWGYDYTTSAVESVTTTTIVESIFKSGCFRLNHDVTLISKDDKEINYIYDSNEVEQYVDPVTYTSDSQTTDNFQTGKWYYNSRQIKEYADKTGLPVLCIYSLLGCTPCQIYEENIWDNALFQQWVSKQKFLFCGMNVQQQPYYDASLRYCKNEWSKDADNYIRIGETSEISNVFGEQFKDTVDAKGNPNSTLMTPVIIFYHKPLGGSSPTTYMDYTYHNISKHLEVNGVEGVVKILERLCLYHFDDNDIVNPVYCVDVDKRFDLADIADYEDYERFNNYYDSATKIVNLTTYKTLDGLKRQFYSVFDYDDYVGGCGLLDFSFFGEIGITETNPTEWNSKTIGLKWKFDQTYYSLSFDMTDTRDVRSACSGTATGYKTIWTQITTRTTYDMSRDGFETLQAFKNELLQICEESGGEYLGGCPIDDFTVFSSMGLYSGILMERPEYFNNVLDTYEYSFNATEKYLMQLDLTDTKWIHTSCNPDGVTAYKMIWTLQQ